MGDETPLPSKQEGHSADEDEALFDGEPIVMPPFRCDYGINIRVGKGVFINFNCAIIDTCLVTIGDRTMFAPNVSLYSGRHPTDPELRNGIKGPEDGREIHIGEDCWIGGNVVILPGVTIGKGAPSRNICLRQDQG